MSKMFTENEWKDIWVLLVYGWSDLYYQIIIRTNIGHNRKIIGDLFEYKVFLTPDAISTTTTQPNRVNLDRSIEIHQSIRHSIRLGASSFHKRVKEKISKIPKQKGKKSFFLTFQAFTALEPNQTETEPPPPLLPPPPTIIIICPWNSSNFNWKHIGFILPPSQIRFWFI